MRTALNELIVKIEKKFYDTVKFQSGVTLHVDPSWHPEEYSMLKATVVAVPSGVIERPDYKGYEIHMQPGDEILVRYDLVFAYKDQPDRDSPIYKNLLLHYNEETGKHEEYWLCDIQKVFAILKGDEVHMQNGYVMLTPVVEQLQSSLICIPDAYARKEHQDRGIIKHIGKYLSHETPHDVKDGDFIRFTPGVAQKYSIDEKVFWIIRTRHILAKSIA